MTAANVKIFNTEEVQNFINLLSGLEQEGGNPRIKQIIHRVVSDLFKTCHATNKAVKEASFSGFVTSGYCSQTSSS